MVLALQVGSVRTKMDIKIQTKISVLLEKIHYLNQGIQQQGGLASKVDKDLLTNYVRELYELVLSMPSQQPYQDPSYMYHSGYQPPMFQQQQQPPLQSEQPYQSQSPTGFIPPSSAPIGNAPSPQSYGLPKQPQIPQAPVNGNYAPAPYPESTQNGYPQPEQQQPDSFSQPSPLNPAFAMSNGKRTLSDSIRIKTGEEKPSLNEQFKRDETHLAGKMQLTPIKDLKTFIGLNKRFSYINFLFGNDANLYDEAIEKLNSSGSKQAAMDYLDNLLRPRLKWTDDNEMVGEFYQLVERRYMG